jgi:hypothetical protein
MKGTDMTYTFCENTVSDLHKDARGFRPSQLWWESWTSAADAQKQQIWDSLLSEFDDTMARERAEEQRALDSLTARINETIELGAGNTVTALKWIMEAEEFDDYDLQYGPNYFCYHFGLSYGVKTELPIQQAMNELLAETV